jgi:NDP-sugar pyrophosphorylase family protein
MHIVIPMSGVGARFQAAGYKDPKPLILADGMPIIEHVVNLFPGETKFTFICNEEHLKTTAMRSVLQRIAPSGTIVGIAPHKHGPVFAVLQAQDLIDDDEEIIVNYCDFGTYWDYQDFLHHTRSRGAAGAIPAYKGFHPHMLGKTNYAFIKDTNQWMEAIKEKEPFTNNRMQEYASNGTYYFARGAYVKKYFAQAMQHNLSINSEFYVSLVYNLLVQDQLPVSVYEIQHMLQWGTPQDLEEYHNWSHYFGQLAKAPTQAQAVEKRSTNLIPLAGRGKRFSDDGYRLPKPLIPVSGKPMIIQAAASLPPAESQTFVCLREHLQTSALEKALLEEYPAAHVIGINSVTEGQACTCAIGLANTDQNAPITIGACDNSMLYDAAAYEKLRTNPTVDAIIWTFKNHPSAKANPQMYGWVAADEQGKATTVSVKKPISQTPENDHAIVGTFYFKKAAYFSAGLSSLYKNNIRVNNEFYVDSLCSELIRLGLNVHVFEVDFYVCWGTPNDLRTFNYWQSFFHKCSWHPYSIENDAMVPPRAKEEIISEVTTRPNQNYETYASALRAAPKSSNESTL